MSFFYQYLKRIKEMNFILIIHGGIFYLEDFFIINIGFFIGAGAALILLVAGIIAFVVVTTSSKHFFINYAFPDNVSM